MDFAEAVSQHQAWKQRLKRILLGRERRRDPGRTEAIECRHCPLDQWIRTVAAEFGEDPLLAEIEACHRASHELAIQMVREDAPDRDPMDIVFQIGRFNIVSRDLLEALEKLRRKRALSGSPLCVISPGFPRISIPGAPT